ncbi:MAG: 4Fe-4S binding protein [Clostridiales bacterium]|nr:4Fe-4S binding protein [Clostridiales bacterium]
MERRVRAMYFSGTGTTAKVVTAVAYEMWEALHENDGNVKYTKAPNINFTPKTARQKQYEFDENDIVVFGTPVIAGRVPNVLLKFLDTLRGDGAMAIPVVVYGNRDFDDALIELRNILEDKGFHTIAAAAFIGEHSFSQTLAEGRPDGEDMELASNFAEKCADKIISVPDLTLAVKVDGNEPLRPYYQPTDRKGVHIDILKVKPKLDETKCNQCGMCVELCPMGSIKKETPGHVEGICIKCCGCVKKCPQQALYFDDPGYLYHKEELELGYAERKSPKLFLD